MHTLTQEIINKVNSIDIIKYVSQYVEIKKSGSVLKCHCPFHNDTEPSMAIYPETNSFWCFKCGNKAGSSLIDFVRKYHKLSFPDAVNHLISYSKIDVSFFKPEPTVIKVLRQYKQKDELRKAIQHTNLTADIMERYLHSAILEWIDEGINQVILDKYLVRYDVNANRIVFPIYDNEGNIINIAGRTLFSNYKELGIRKYTYYYELGSNDFLYGYYQNKDTIKKKREAILVEGAKSVFKLDGWGYSNALAILTSHINKEQIKQILSLHCDIVIALDKNISFTDIKDNFKPLIKFTNVYVIQDHHNYLGEKEAPVDKGKGIWETLYNERIKLN